MFLKHLSQCLACSKYSINSSKKDVGLLKKKTKNLLSPPCVMTRVSEERWHWVLTEVEEETDL